MQCQYCKKTFSSKGNLNTHEKSAKYCLELKKKSNIEYTFEIYNCKHCNKDFSQKSNLDKHITICKIKNNEDQKNSYEKQLQEKDKQILELKSQIEKLQDVIASIEAQPKIIQNTVQTTNDTTKNTINNRVNIINNLVPITDDEYKKLPDMLKREYVESGLDGYVKLATEFYKDKAVCTDLSRKMITHKDADGKIVVDPNMSKLTTKFFSAILTKNRQVLGDILKEIEEKLDDSKIDHDEYFSGCCKFSQQRLNTRLLAEGDEPREAGDEYLEFKNSYTNKICDNIYVK
jgi:hypothetical protein|uniref:C2H2-type domain-containing protein n=1 Tax=viral metagenome TaxID=1070528 RepID=A0A6C0CZ82_9ZZZZ